MKNRFLSILLLVVFTACTARPAPADLTPSETPEAASALPTPVVEVTRVPDISNSARQFLDNWKNAAYAAMFDQLSSRSKSQINADNFILRYQEAAIGMTLNAIEYSLGAPTVSTTGGSLPFHVTYITNAVGNLERDMSMNLVLEDSQWKVDWDDGLIMPELKGGNTLAMDIKVPARGDIYDRNGFPLASQQDAYAISVVPTQLGNGEGSALSGISELTGRPIPALAQIIEDNRTAYWAIPMGEATAEEVEKKYDWLTKVSGVSLSGYTTRLYPSNGIGPHVTGYVQAIPAEKLDEYKQKGYRMNAMIGKAGLESWGDDILDGTRGANLVLLNPEGQAISSLAKTDSLPADSITTTLDSKLQKQVQQALGGFRGAIVVMELETGKILAMASSPSFDPNAFDFNNPNSFGLTAAMGENADQPLVNRATQGTYPLGSVFKIVTMAAALESGLYTAESKLDCAHEFTELPGVTLYDWTYEREVPPSGMLTLPQGLMRSCNIWFYHIGLDLYRQNRPDDITNMALAFGLGKETGIGQVAESTGSIPFPSNEEEATQQGIGQGAMLVTPLQVVNLIAAIGNNGKLMQPQVVEKITKADGTEIQKFEPVQKGTLPVSPENLKIIQSAMQSVVSHDRGTAHSLYFSGIKIYGKTGTATNPMGKPHAWFAGYTVENGSKPNIAAVVLLENAGEGSSMAVPVFRRVMESYFRGQPQTVYPWESGYDVTRTPTPVVTETPEPLKTP